MNSFEMAKALINSSSSRSGNTASHKASQTTTIFGTATSDSEDGKVRVLFDGDSTGTDEDGSIEVSTTFSIKEGDTVIVSLIGADGTGKYPIVVGVEGRGDEQKAEIDTAMTNAAEALEAAEDAQEIAENAIISQINYYILSASTPSTPTEESHSSWSTTEPVWSDTSTDNLYISIRTVYGNGTITWTAPAIVQAFADINIARNAIISTVSETYVAQGDSNITELSSTMKQDVNGVNIYNDISHVGDTYAHIDGDEFAIRKISTADTISESDVTMATFGANGMFVSAQNGETSNNALEVALIESETTVPVDLLDYITISGRSVILNAGAKVITSSAAYPFLTLTDISSSIFSVIALYGTNKQRSQSIGLAPTLDPTSNSLSWGRVGTAVPDTFDGEQFTRIVNVNIYVVIAGTVNASSITDGYQTTASGQYSKAEGSRTVASGANSHSEGIETTASGNASHAEGTGTTASSSYSHAEGRNTTADGLYCHAEGDTTTAKGGYSHAEGQYTSANVIASHAEGVSTTVSGAGSHAEGRHTAVSGGYSHAEGLYTLASSAYQHVCGKYNIEDTSDTYAEIVGNGTNATRANARTLDWYGNEKLAGEIDASMRTATVNGYLGTLHLYRFGRVVFLTTDDFKSKSSSVASGTVLTQIIPLGFRPIRIAVVPKPITTSTNNAFFEFGPDGSITYKGSTSWANATAWSGTWITGDD